MTLLFWILVISAVLIIGLIAYKGFESSRGGILFAPFYRKKMDDFVENQANILKGKENGFSKKIRKFFEGLPHLINMFLHRMWEKISGKIDGYFERLRGHHNIVKKD